MNRRILQSGLVLGAAIILAVGCQTTNTTSGGAVGVGEAVGRSMRTSLISNVVVVLLFSLALYGTDPNFNLTV